MLEPGAAWVTNGSKQPAIATRRDLSFILVKSLLPCRLDPDAGNVLGEDETALFSEELFDCRVQMMIQSILEQEPSLYTFPPGCLLARHYPQIYCIFTEFARDEVDWRWFPALVALDYIPPFERTRCHHKTHPTGWYTSPHYKQI
jgi:hypothetical protein